MPKNIALMMLDQGNTGNDLLMILDSLIEDTISDESESPTLEEIKF